MSFKVALLETCGRVQSVPRAAVQCHDNWNNNLKDESSGGSPCLVVMGLMFERLWVQIPTQYTGWTFFTLICCKNCIVCLKRLKIKE